MQLGRTTPGSSRGGVQPGVCGAGSGGVDTGADYLWAWLVLGEPSFNSTGVFNGKVQVSYLANLFLSLCMAEAFSQVCGGGRHVVVSSPLLAGLGRAVAGDVFRCAQWPDWRGIAVCFHRVC